MEKKALVLYHAGCVDGYTACYTAWKRVGAEAEYVPVQYGEPPPDVTGREVYVLDFSYKRPEMLQIIDKAASVVVLDHHASAEKELANLPIPPGKLCRIIFDDSRSGAVLAHQFFFPVTPIPELIFLVEDRDLWSWRLPNSKEISAAIASRPFDFHEYATLEKLLATEPHLLVFEGRAILRYQEQEITRILANAREIILDGNRVLSCNTPVHISEVAGRLAKGRLFGVCYFVSARGQKVYSLRSDQNDPRSLDVSEIAQRHGGGGHKHAAGFTA